MMNYSKWLVATLNTSKEFEVYGNENAHIKISGTEGKFADEIFAKMSINYDTVFPEDNEYGREIHGGNWTGLIGMVKRGEADLAVGTLGISEDRFRVIDFSFPYTADRLTFAVLKPSQWLTTFGFFDVFDFPTWMLLLSSFFLSTVMFFSVLKGTVSYFEIVYDLFGSLMRQPLIFRNYMREKKFLVGTWLLFSCVMSTVFSGVLLSFLAKPSKAPIIKNFRELSRAVDRGTHHVYSLNGTLTVPFFLNSKEPYLRLLGRMIEQNNWYIPREEMINNPLKNTHSAIVCQYGYLKLLFGTQSRILISEDSGYTVSTAFAIRKKFCCATQLRKVMSRLISAGIYDRIFKLESLRRSLSSPFSEEEMDEERTLTLHHLLGAFYILFTGLALSILVFVGEVILHYNARVT
ncbi:lig_chan-Glu_bd domain-containing protein [Trichonephila inaurata madagascariensis]|uniref:Lig_chan-Glu_bd domain-containing protein n=1 Tax=Trichonephila inaurata madagascariensis TaxID=2747483 RepID=A0A8X7CE88_9ARAC|nr:lig_chan-Glu_bd domain-containing protein [Trichonephila inaurata madagascariensis]